MGKLYFEALPTKNYEYVILVGEQGIGFGYFSVREAKIVKEAKDAYEFPNKKKATDFISQKGPLLEKKWEEREPSSINTPVTH